MINNDRFSSLIQRTAGAAGVKVPRPKVQDWTVFVQDIDGGFHIQSYRARSIEGAIEQAMREVASARSQKRRTLHVLGVARGNVEIVEWNDLEC